MTQHRCSRCERQFSGETLGLIRIATWGVKLNITVHTADEFQHVCPPCVMEALTGTGFRRAVTAMAAQAQAQATPDITAAGKAALDAMQEIGAQREEQKGPYREAVDDALDALYGGSKGAEPTRQGAADAMTEAAEEVQHIQLPDTASVMAAHVQAVRAASIARSGPGPAATASRRAALDAMTAAFRAAVTAAWEVETKAPRSATEGPTREAAVAAILSRARNSEEAADMIEALDARHEKSAEPRVTAEQALAELRGFAEGVLSMELNGLDVPALTLRVQILAQRHGIKLAEPRRRPPFNPMIEPEIGGDS